MLLYLLDRAGTIAIENRDVSLAKYDKVIKGSMYLAGMLLSHDSVFCDMNCLTEHELTYPFYDTRETLRVMRACGKNSSVSKGQHMTCIELFSLYDRPVVDFL
jgi:hypothetical protein